LEQIFIAAPPGVEQITASELTGLGILLSPEAVTGGGIEFAGNLEQIYRTNLWLRSASRVLVRLGEFYAAAFSELRKKASRLPWENYLRPGDPVCIHATCHKSKLYHSDAVVERVLGAIADRLGKPSTLVNQDEENPSNLSQLVVVRISNNNCTISIDSSGELLHRRGYRLAVAKAPLRENLAAAMLLASGWDGSSPLIDPFCGSGPIPIEAALIARNIAPGTKRSFAFMKWPNFNKPLWNKITKQAVASASNQTPMILASDRDQGAVQMAQSNAERAGVASFIQFSCQPFSAIEPTPQKGWLISNPPYGLRIHSNQDLRNLYAQLGNVLRKSFPEWQVGLLCSDYKLISQTRLPFNTNISFLNGGLPVKYSIASII
jgi:putative N6-adenine-specific DNA methylase